MDVHDSAAYICHIHGSVPSHLKLVFGADSSKHTSGIHALMRADMRCRLGREFLLAACNLELFVLHQRRSFLFLLVLCSNLQIVVYLHVIVFWKHLLVVFTALHVAERGSTCSLSLALHCMSLVLCSFTGYIRKDKCDC
jgi:hypothetical protein